MHRRDLVLGGAIAAGVLAVGVVVAIVSPVSSSFAQTPPPGALTSRLDRMADHLAKLAANLGVTTEQLKAAQLKTANQQIDEALAAGRLTAEQAAQAKARIASGKLPGPGMHGPGMDGRDRRGPGGPGKPGGIPGGMQCTHRGPGGDMMATAAAAIGIDQATLMTELRTGQVARAGGRGAREDA